MSATRSHREGGIDAPPQIEADPVFNPPAAALLRQTRSPVRVLWSPDAA